ncbi:MAG: response regulator [Candidatus Margulisbacteria bacterium]|nr:response regulator [Candidatus Margulisiibacteriota bacterium]
MNSNIDILKSASILFVDDDVDNLDAILRCFRKEPYACYSATSAKEGLDILQNNNINVLIVDLMMPQMNGLEFLDITKQRFPDVTRIVLSGYAEFSSIISTINLCEIHRYIPKPWELNDDAKECIREAITFSIRTNSDHLELDEILIFQKETFRQLFVKLEKSYVVYNEYSEVIDSNLDSLNPEYLNQLISGKALLTCLELQKKYKLYVFEV